MNNSFELPGSYKKWTMGLIAVGFIALLYGLVAFHPFAHPEHGENVNSTRFWAVLLQNCTFWLMICNASMFFIGVTTLAMGGWQVALRRVPEAISSVVPVLGVICFVIVMIIVWGDRHDIYHWVDAEAVAKDKILNGKKGFLNPVFFSVFSAVTIFLWWFLGKKMRQFSLESDTSGHMDFETGDKWVKKNIPVKN